MTKRKEALFKLFAGIGLIVVSPEFPAAAGLPMLLCGAFLAFSVLDDE